MEQLPTENLFRASPLEFRDAADGQPVLSVPLAPFGEWTLIDSVSEGRFMERWDPEAFVRSFAEVEPKAMFQHGRDPQIGEQLLGSPVSIRDGAYETPLFSSVPPLILDGLRAKAYGASFRFNVPLGGDSVVYKPKRSDYNPEGLPERTVTGGLVREVGPVTFGAYPGATAGVRSLTDEFRPYDFDREIGEMAREHPKELAAVISKALKGSEAESSDPKPQPQPRFRSREEFLAWMSQS
jgi:hypothetical protein